MVSSLVALCAICALCALVIGIAGLAIAVEARNANAENIDLPGGGAPDRGTILIFDGEKWVPQYLPIHIFDLEVLPNSYFSFTGTDELQEEISIEPAAVGESAECRFLASAEGGTASCLVEIFKAGDSVFSQLTPIVSNIMTPYVFDIPMSTFTEDDAVYTISISAPTGTVLISDLTIKTVQS